MANREPKKGENAGKSAERNHIVETVPNAHSEQTIAEMPIETGHRATTEDIAAQNPSTAENRMNPSVVVQDSSTDSMFNLADLQTREILKNESDKDRASRLNRGPRRRKGRITSFFG